MNMFNVSMRNLGRNYRRSMVAIISIALGFAATALFAGYTKMVYRGLQEQAIHGELLGHLTLTRSGPPADRRLHPERYLFSQNDIEDIRALSRKINADMVVAPRLRLVGMLSNGRSSTIFIGEGVDPGDMKLLRGQRQLASGGLAGELPNAVTVARGLADMLALADGSDASMLVSTVHGQANAQDVVVSDLFGTGNAATDDKFMFIPLEMAQSLYDAEHQADRLTLLLPPGTAADDMRTQLEATLHRAGHAVDIGTWQEMSAFYQQVRSMFDRIFGFLLAIVLTIVVMSIANAMSMSVVERTREIGTLRAMGMRRAGIARMFSLEALLLVLLGCLLGATLAAAVGAAVNAAGITYLPPNSTEQVPLLIGLDQGKTTLAVLLLTGLGVIAALFPAWRAARQPIIDSLGHV